MIDVMIHGLGDGEENKGPGRLFAKPVRAEVRVYTSLQQMEFLSAANGCPTVVHSKLAVNVLGVGTQGTQ
jgi:hypothetical protein